MHCAPHANVIAWFQSFSSMLTCVFLSVSVPEAFEDDQSSNPEGGLAWLDDAMTMVCILITVAGDSMQRTAPHIIDVTWTEMSLAGSSRSNWCPRVRTCPAGTPSSLADTLDVPRMRLFVWVCPFAGVWAGTRSERRNAAIMSTKALARGGRERSCTARRHGVQEGHTGQGGRLRSAQN